MKKLILNAVLTLSLNVFGQSKVDSLYFQFGWAKDCNSEFVFDYRMIYSEYELTEADLIEKFLDARYNLTVIYEMGEFGIPDDLLVEIIHVGHPTFVIITKLCLVEEYFQLGILNDKILSYYKAAKNSR